MLGAAWERGREEGRLVQTGLLASGAAPSVTINPQSLTFFKLCCHVVESGTIIVPGLRHPLLDHSGLSYDKVSEVFADMSFAGDESVFQRGSQGSGETEPK